MTCEEILMKNEQDRRLYELREKAIAEEITLIHGAKAEGEAQGIEKVAKNLLSMGVDIKQIQLATNLAEEEILRLKNDLN